MLGVEAQSIALVRQKNVDIEPYGLPKIDIDTKSCHKKFTQNSWSCHQRKTHSIAADKQALHAQPGPFRESLFVYQPIYSEP